MSDDNASRLAASLTAAEKLYILLEVHVEVEDINLETVEVLLVHLAEPLLHLTDEVVALKVDVGETVGPEDREEMGGGDLEEQLLEGHDGASSDYDVAVHLDAVAHSVVEGEVVAFTVETARAK